MSRVVAARRTFELRAEHLVARSTDAGDEFAELAASVRIVDGAPEPIELVPGELPVADPGHPPVVVSASQERSIGARTAGS
jgi:hypothetical protein